MKTVLEITYNLPNETFINRHVASLFQHGYPVQVLARQVSKEQAESASVQEKSDFEINPNPRVIPKLSYFPPKDLIIILKQFVTTRNFSYSKSLFRNRVSLEFIKRLNPDLVHFHFGGVAGLMCWIPQELGIPYTLSLRGSDIQVMPLISNQKAERLQKGLNQAAGIHTVSDSLWDLAKPYLIKEIFHKTIYTTVPINESLPDKNGNNGDVRFVTIGRLHWRKNFVDLLKAFRQLLDAGLNAELVIVGEGSEKEGLLYWVSVLGLQKNIVFTGKLESMSVNDILSNATGYIQSSIVEGFSNATAEAMALGLPVFATDVGGTREIIQDGINGFLLDPLRPDEWYKKLLIVKNSQLMESIRVNAWKTAEEKFSESVHANAFINFYEHILNDQK
jgi:colanic acid/amylovoran biosynthesis glycosyltransferase